MPIYEYSCSKCGEFEVTQRITDDPLTRCPTCRRKIHKLISHCSFQLKGSGWYVTDYARKDNGNGADAATQTGEAKVDGKAESKPNSKSEATGKSTPGSADKVKAKAEKSGSKAA